VKRDAAARRAAASEEAGQILDDAADQADLLVQAATVNADDLLSAAQREVCTSGRTSPSRSPRPEATSTTSGPPRVTTPSAS
jgi:cell division septum initiation protein DivIVA